MKSSDQPRQALSSGGSSEIVEELMSVNSQFKSTISRGRDGILRVSTLRRVGDEPAKPCWEQVDGPVLVDSLKTARKIAGELLLAIPHHQPDEGFRERIRVVLMKHWDPLGVSEVPEAAFDYDFYIDPISELLRSGATEKELVEYLYSTETKEMGLMRFGMRGRCKKAVAKLREIELYH